MLFNAKFNHELTVVEEIWNETTKQIYSTIDEFFNDIDTFDETNHIAHLSIIYPIIEPYIIKHYNMRCNKGKNYTTVQARFLKPNEYAVKMYTTDGSSAKKVDYFMLNHGGRVIYFINFDNFAEYHNINEHYSTDEIELQTYFAETDMRKTSPTAAALDELNAETIPKNGTNGKGFSNTVNADLVNPFLVILLRSLNNNPAIITAPYIGHIDKAYGYDINSMYPAVLVSMEHLPDMQQAVIATKQGILPDNYYAVNFDGIKMPGDSFNQGDWILPPESRDNPLKQFMLNKYEEKRQLKTIGGAQYRFFKMKMNCIIGNFAVKSHSRIYYNYCADNEGKYNAPKKTIPRIEINIIVTALARKLIAAWMDFAQSQGCTILQVNTDGFITDIPIPGVEYNLELGELRLDKVLTNLDIYEMNRYTSNETVCISGLPKNLYKPGVTIYKFEIIQ